MIRISWDDLNPVVHFGLYFKTDPDFQLGPHYTSNHSFIYIVKGKADVVIQGQAYDAVAGDLFYTGPDVSYMYQAIAEDPFELIGINFDLTGRFPEKFHELPHHEPVGKGDIERPNLLFIGEPGHDELCVPQHTVIDLNSMHPLFLKFAAQHKKHGPIADALNRSLLIQMFVLLKQQTQQKHTDLSPLQNMLHRVRTCLIQYAELPYTRQWLIDWTGYHIDYISHAFREEFGLSPHDFHLQMKIERAKELLEHTKLTVSAIGDQLQFSSIHYFSRAFKKHVGQSPLQYRKNG